MNLTQVCRIEYRRSYVSRDEINGFDLYLTDGTAVTLERGDSGFERVVAELEGARHRGDGGDGNKRMRGRTGTEWIM